MWVIIKMYKHIDIYNTTGGNNNIDGNIQKINVIDWLLK
jgi:hypothetical protein